MWARSADCLARPETHCTTTSAEALLDGLLLALVAGLREHLPRLGTHKLHLLLLPRLGEYAPQVGLCPAGRPRPADLPPQTARSDHAALLAAVSAAEPD